MNIELRSPAKNDLEFARDAHHGGYHDVVIRQFGAWDEREQDDFFDLAWSTYEHTMIVVNQEVVGYCCIEYPAGYVHIREFVIHPSKHRRGIAAALMRMIQQDAARAGLPIRLGVFKQSEAQMFYQKLGFKSFDQTETHILLEWNERADV